VTTAGDPVPAPAVLPVPPTGRIVVFGATGYTGDLAVRALVRDGVRPVIAGRDPVRLARLAAELGAGAGGRGASLDHLVADVQEPASVAGLVGPGDVLLSTVGPFARWGAPAVEAAAGAGAHYVDSTGEGSFLRRVFERDGPLAEAAGSALLPAFGYDYVPGNLAGALALERARDDHPARPAVAVDVGYFLTGPTGAAGMSGGTRASALGVIGTQGYGLLDGRIVDERPGAEVVTLTAAGRRRTGLAVPASEHFALPRLAPSLRRVRVGLGWFGAATPAVSLLSRGVGMLDAVPPVRDTLGRWGSGVFRRLVRGSTGGPDEAARARSGSLVVADALDAAGEVLAHVELTGPNGYTLTGDLLAWAARSAAAGRLQGVGALGPVEAFGLDTLRDACAAAGLREAADAV